MTLKESAYLEKKPISYMSKALGKTIVVPSGQVIEGIIGSNIYLNTLRRLFNGLNFDVFVTLGQRNLSGFISEVFTRVLVEKIEGFKVNPHADGRPDLIDISTAKAQEHFDRNCLSKLEEGELAPIRSFLAPFKYGGIEVKATIGEPDKDYKAKLNPDYSRCAVKGSVSVD